MGKDFRLEKDVHLSLLDSGLADNVGDLGNKLRTLARHFAKLSRAKPAVNYCPSACDKA